MKIKLEEDFIYTYAKEEAVLILKNCSNSCSFCPAQKLKSFYNYSLLHACFDFDCKKLTIYGNANCSYVETFLKKLLDLNPKVEVHIYGCTCEFSQKLDVNYHHITHPNLPNYMRMNPCELVIPAIGEDIALLAHALKCSNRFPGIPIKLKVLDSANLNAEFLPLDRISNLQKQIDLKEFGI